MSVVEQERVVEREKIAEIDEAGKVLVEAAEEVRKNWTQFDGQRYVSGGSGVCAMIAIWRSHGTDDEAELAANRLVMSLGFQDRDQVIDWNDAPGRTAEEVAEALERAAWGL